jgi:NDP-sugar pyrophosphorylase family protein
VKAVVLAGGLGTRLRPLSFTIPKPLLPVGNKPILEIILQNLSENGIKEVILAVGYRADLIRAYVSQIHMKGLKIHFVQENRRLGTAGPLLLAEKYLRGADSFFAMNSDILTRISFKKLWATHTKSKAEVTIATRPYHYRCPYGVLKTNGPWLESIEEKPHFSFNISSGIYCFKKSALKLIPTKTYFDIPQLLEKILKNDGKIAAHRFTAPWKAIEELGDFRGIRFSDWNA